jgi:hypothetical protein
MMCAHSLDSLGCVAHIWVLIYVSCPFLCTFLYFIRSEGGKRRKQSQVWCYTYFGILSFHPPKRQERKVKVKKCDPPCHEDI